MHLHNNVINLAATSNMITYIYKQQERVEKLAIEQIIQYIYHNICALAVTPLSIPDVTCDRLQRVTSRCPNITNNRQTVKLARSRMSNLLVVELEEHS